MTPEQSAEIQQYTKGVKRARSTYSREQQVWRDRRKWLVKMFRADQNVLRGQPVPIGEGRPACRCYRCGCLLSVDAVVVIMVRPRSNGGTYQASNIRPACGTCNALLDGSVL